MDFYQILFARKFGLCSGFYEAQFGRKLGGYSWQSDYETTPYLYRAMPNLSHYYNREIMEEVVGGSVGWNQWLQNPSTVTRKGVTLTNNGDGSVTINGTNTESSSALFTFVNNISFANGHKMLLIGSASMGGWNSFTIYNDAVGAVSAVGNKGYSMFVANGNNGSVNIAVWAGTTVNNVKVVPQLTDLTLALGSTIADYVYSLEQATADSGVAWLKEHFPRMCQYNPYDSGSIQSVSGLVSHTTKDANDNAIGSYPLDSTLTLRGIPKLDNGKLYYDGDTYGADGSVIRKYGVVDLGSLDWAYNSNWNGAGAFYTTAAVPMIFTNQPMETIANMLCLYPTYSRNALYDATTAKGVCLNSGGQISIRDSAYTDATAFKTAMSGVYLVYPLATPTTETAQPFTKTQLCDSGGTEEFVTSGIVSVGHKSKYAEK